MVDSDKEKSKWHSQTRHFGEDDRTVWLIPEYNIKTIFLSWSGFFSSLLTTHFFLTWLPMPILLRLVTVEFLLPALVLRPAAALLRTAVRPVSFALSRQARPPHLYCADQLAMFWQWGLQQRLDDVSYLVSLFVFLNGERTIRWSIACRKHLLTGRAEFSMSLSSWWKHYAFLLLCFL
jgi:hypothetical protein